MAPSRVSSAMRLKNMHDERQRKTKAIEEKIRNARERAEQQRFRGRVLVAPINVSKTNRA